MAAVQGRAHTHDARGERARRTAASSDPTSLPESNVTRWTDCFTGDDTTQQIDIGVAVGSQFLDFFGSKDAAMAFVQATITTANYHIYERQVNVVLAVKRASSNQRARTHARTHRAQTAMWLR